MFPKLSGPAYVLHTHCMQSMHLSLCCCCRETWGPRKLIHMRVVLKLPYDHGEKVLGLGLRNNLVSSGSICETETANLLAYVEGKIQY